MSKLNWHWLSLIKPFFFVSTLKGGCGTKMWPDGKW